MTADLTAWQQERIGGLRETPVAPPRFPSVTLLAYHFWDEARQDAQFERVEGAVLESWRHCGRLRTCLVLNRVTRHIERFAERHSPWVTLRESPCLVPGDVPSMSVDCNANLHRYFDTEHVLVIQNDGFPLRPGLEAFLGTCDYVGAPFVRRTTGNRLLGLWPRFAVGNGGFSLRTRRICEQAAYYWGRRYCRLLRHDSRFAREDAYYCFVLPLLERAYRRSMRFAPWEEAARFSYDSLYGGDVAALPFGFHGQGAFRTFVERGLLT